MSKKTPGVVVHVIKADALVSKADNSTQLSGTKEFATTDWIEPPYDMKGLRNSVSKSSILPQCIKAYKNNIAGFGIGIRYKGDENDSNEAAAAEYVRAEEIIELLSMDMDTKEVFEDVIEARETYGIAYLEIIRNGIGDIVGIDFIKDTGTVRKTSPLLPYVGVKHLFKDRVEKRSKKFCKYKQKVGNQTVYFKEVGDPRAMDNRTGDYGESTSPEHQANELLEFAIGTEPYGEIRWIGQVLGINGSRKAEELNNRYFEEGRHTPLLILIKGGTLTEPSFDKLKGYMNDIKGESGQHAFMVLEVESAESQTMIDDVQQPEIQVVPLAEVLQKDELFQEYLDNNRRRVQSSFLLPDLYVGYTTDFNRATAQTAMEVTEEQVFQPERVSLAWAVNNKLLAGYQFKYVEAYFKAPNITNPDDLSKLLTICERAGGLPPNKAKQIAYAALGDVSEDYPEEWGEIPAAFARTMGGAVAAPSAAMPSVTAQLDDQIQKASASDDEDITAVLKEIRGLLPEDEAVEKYNPNQPRDAQGRWVKGSAVSNGDTTSAEEKQKKIDSVDIDFEADNTLPGLNEETLSELGREDKPVLLKKSVIERNLQIHDEVKKDEYNYLLGQALYNNPTHFHGHKDNYINLVSKINDGRNSLVLIEMADNKDCYEIIHIMRINDSNLKRMKKS